MADGRTMAGGRGIQVQLGAELKATRVLVAGSIDMGIVVSAGARVQLTDLHVADVVPRTCTWPGCVETGVAYAVVVISVDLAMEEFTLTAPPPAASS